MKTDIQIQISSISNDLDALKMDVIQSDYEEDVIENMVDVIEEAIDCLSALEAMTWR